MDHTEEMQHLLSTKDWNRLLSIYEFDYHELTLEFLATFRLSRQFSNQDRECQMEFYLFGVLHNMSYMEFALCFSLYTIDFTRTKDYPELADN